LRASLRCTGIRSGVVGIALWEQGRERCFGVEWIGGENGEGEHECAGEADSAPGAEAESMQDDRSWPQIGGSIARDGEDC